MLGIAGRITAYPLGAKLLAQDGVIRVASGYAAAQQLFESGRINWPASRERASAKSRISPWLISAETTR
jgi:hypothetical protein